MNPDTYQRITELISQDKLEDAFNLLSDLNGRTDENLILIKARFSEIKRLEQNHLLPIGEIFQYRDKLRHQFMLYVKEQYENYLSSQNSSNNSSLPTLEQVKALKESGRYADAIDILKEILDKNFDDKTAIELGILQTDIGELDTAINTYQLILKRNPKSHAALNNIGVAYDRMGNPQQSIYYTNRAYALEPAILYLKNLIISLTQLKDFTTIIDMVSSHLQKFGDDPDLYCERAKAYLALENRNLKAAFDDINKAINIRPQEGNYYHIRGQIYSANNQMEDARKEADLAIYFSQDPYYKIYLGALLLDMKKYDDALKSLSQAIILHPDSSRLYLLRAHCNMYLNQIENARNDFEQVLALDPNECEAYEMLAKIYYDWKYYTHAKSYELKGGECRESIIKFKLIQ